MLDKVVDLVRAFINEPKLASNQFFNIIIMGVAGTGKTRLAETLGSAIRAQLGHVRLRRVRRVAASATSSPAYCRPDRAPRCVSFLTENAEKVIFLDEAYALTAVEPARSTQRSSRATRPRPSPS